MSTKGCPRPDIPPCTACILIPISDRRDALEAERTGRGGAGRERARPHRRHAHQDGAGVAEGARVTEEAHLRAEHDEQRPESDAARGGEGEGQGEARVEAQE